MDILLHIYISKKIMQQFLGRYISRMDIVCFNLQTQNAEKIMCAFFSEKKKKKIDNDFSVPTCMTYGRQPSIS
jgi:hypothetical protein